MLPCYTRAFARCSSRAIALGFYLPAGLVGMLFFHVLVNVGMTIGIMPITGIPLPFMSYGGSAMLTDFAALGILLNIFSQRDRDVLGNA